MIQEFFSDFYSSFLGDISIEIACGHNIQHIYDNKKSWPLALAVILASFSIELCYIL